MLQHYILNQKTETINTILGEKIINLLDKTFNIPKDFTFQLIEVSSDYIARPDLISQQIYDTDRYTDILCKINGISNPFELNEGDLLIIPEYEDIDNFYQYDIMPDNSVTKQKSKLKTKKDKRKANEAILGDKRFRIDEKRKIIIY